MRTRPIPNQSGVLRGWRWALLAALGLTATYACAQPTTPPRSPAPTAPAPRTAAGGPAWKELSPTQQEALKPLNTLWKDLSADQKRKWITLSQNFAHLSPQEQAKLHARMTSWTSLSPQQRSQARLNFSETKKISSEERAAQWRAYQELSPEERRALASKAQTKATGAAIVKPAQQQRLTSVPLTRNAPKPAPNTPAPAIDRRTLLPQPPAEPAPPPEPAPTVEPAPIATPDADTSD